MPVGEADERRGGKANPIARSNRKALIFKAFLLLKTEKFSVLPKNRTIVKRKGRETATSEQLQSLCPFLVKSTFICRKPS